MSSPPRPGPSPAAAPIRLSDLAAMAAAGQRIVMVTAYDFPTAQLVDGAGVDIVLVGDSAANVVLGHPSTVAVTTDELLVLVKAVRRGVRRALLVADLPFGSYEVSDEDAVRAAIRFVKEGGADAVKIERGGTSVARARAIVAAGIPVMGHVGLTPQTATALGGYRPRAESRRLRGDHRRSPRPGGCRLLLRGRRSRPRPGRRPHRRAARGARSSASAPAARSTARCSCCTTCSACRRDGRRSSCAATPTSPVRSPTPSARYAAEVRAGAFPTAEHAYPMSADGAAPLPRRRRAHRRRLIRPSGQRSPSRPRSAAVAPSWSPRASASWYRSTRRAHLAATVRDHR